MELQKLVYLLLLLTYLIIPVAISFKNKIRLFTRLRYLIPAVLFAGAIFIMWDIRFTEFEIWTYNPEYLTGINLLNIPVEKWLSLAIIPISGAYIYEGLKVKTENSDKSNIFIAISLVIFIVLAVLAYIFRKNVFSFFTYFLTAIYLGYTIFRNRFKSHYFAFYMTFLIMLIPFVFVSAFIGNLPIIAYSADQIMGLSIFAVPFEKFAYLFLMLLINLTIYEYLNERRYY